MATFAAVDFALAQQKIVAGTDLSAYPVSTLAYLAKRGLTASQTTFKAAKAFSYAGTSYAVDAAVTGLPVSVLTQLLRSGHVIGGAPAWTAADIRVRGAAVTAAGTTITIPTVEPGDLIIVSSGQRTASVGFTAGYTRQAAANGQSTGNANSTYTDFFWKIADGTEDGTSFSITGASGDPVMECLVLYDFNGGVLSVAQASQIATDVNQGSRVLPTLTTDTTNQMIVYLGSARNANPGPATLSITGTVAGSATVPNSITTIGLVAWEVKATAGVTPAHSLTITGSTSGIGGWTIAVKAVAP